VNELYFPWFPLSHSYLIKLLTLFFGGGAFLVLRLCQKSHLKHFCFIYSKIKQVEKRNLYSNNKAQNKPPGMDDANLKRLVVDQMGMVPDFTPGVTNYKIVVASGVETLKISATTSDTGASFSVKSKANAFDGL